jgi:hypothetical protein
MPQNGLYLQAAGKIAERVPGLRALPMVRLIMAAEVLAIGKHHLDALTPAERSRMLRLLAQAKGRPKNLSTAEQEELTAIVRKLEPRLFLAEAGDKLSPVGVPSPLRSRIVGRNR